MGANVRGLPAEIIIDGRDAGAHVEARTAGPQLVETGRAAMRAVAFCAEGNATGPVGLGAEPRAKGGHDEIRQQPSARISRNNVGRGILPAGTGPSMGVGGGLCPPLLRRRPECRFPERKNYPRFGVDGQIALRPFSGHSQELSIVFSEDDGKNWSSPQVIIRKQDYGIAYPYLFELEPGRTWLSALYSYRMALTFDEQDFVGHTALPREASE